jgi:3-hydroxybutyryl-CoA dehydrogenase
MKASKLSRVTVVGAGTMGAGIAGEFARIGCDVRLIDKGDDLAAACQGTQLLIEAVFEDMALKRELFRQFDKLCPKTAVLASNTSGLSITRIAAATKRPKLVAGIHFWNPPQIIPLVEVTKGRKTSDSTAKFLMDVCKRIGKRPILVRHDIPGIVGNRLQFAVMREALHLLSRGIASAEDIDTAMTAGPGLRYALLGPLRIADLGGLDVFRNISRYLFKDLASDAKPVQVLEELVNQGRLGAKSGKGFYRYSPKELKAIIARRNRVLLKFQEILKGEQ